MQTDFINIKNAVIATITSSTEEVLPTTKIKKSGIYTVHYFVTDRNGAKGHSVLNVVVE